MKEKLMEIEKVANKYNESILSNSTEEQLNKAKKWLEKKLDTSDIIQFVELISIANGFEFDGLIVYSLNSDSDNEIFEANSIWHENGDLMKYLFFADNDMSWYCFDTERRVFCELDKPSGDIMNTFDNYNKMMGYALETIM